MEEKKYSIWKILSRMLKKVAEEQKSLITSTMFHMVIAGVYPFFAVLLPKLLITVLEGSEKVVQSQTDKSLIQMGIIVGGFFLAAGLFGYLQATLHNRDNPRISKLRLSDLDRTFHKLLTMDYKYHEDAKFLNQYERAFTATGTNNNGIEGIYHKLYSMPATFLSILILILLVGVSNPLILLGLALSIGVNLWVQNRTNQFEYSKREEQIKASRRRDYYYRTTYDFSYGKDIRLFDFHKRIVDNYNYEIDRYLNVVKIIRNKEFLLGFLHLAVVLISDMLIYGILVYRVMHGMSLADFSMYLSAIITLTGLLLTISTDVAFVYKEGLYVDDFFRFIDADLGNKGGTKPALKDTLEIEFRNVTFRYPGSEIDVFKNLNFTIHKGEKLAIVGINGAGKSTLVKMMVGLFEPTEGEILVNGVSQKEFDKQEYYKMFSVVFQDVNPLAYTIGENVSCSSDEIEEERVWDCLKRVGLEGKVRQFDAGLNQMMLKVIDENGTEFSGGESQKLMIARALYKDANMVILDEPTAALDALAEADIYQNFNDLVADKTAVYISHRLSSTKFCDKIALFDEHGLIEYGNHEDLMEMRGEYYHMFTVQGQYYREEESA